MLIFFALTFLIVFCVWLATNRSYESTASVASAYDSWTKDKLLETLWGDHVHLGYYQKPHEKIDFRFAKVSFVHQLVHWSGLDKLPPGSKVLDVGCGIGGSARILAKDYGFDVLGITISPAQVERARELTPSGMKCRFEVMDAMNLKLPTGSFDGVWSVEAGPHMPDKQLYADELLRVLGTNGCLAIADWNCRDFTVKNMNCIERLVMHQLLAQWAHPSFSSIKSFRENLINSSFSSGGIDTDDWTVYTLPSWLDSVYEGLRRPIAILRLGPKAIIQGLREIPTILLMNWAFSNQLMEFGVFRKTKSFN